MTEKATEPTWGYKPDGQKRIFNLAPGEKLPEEWSDMPAPGHHPHDKEQGRFPNKPEDAPDANPAAKADEQRRAMHARVKFEPEAEKASLDPDGKPGTGGTPKSKSAA